MLAELAVASAMVLLTVSIHAVGLWALQLAFRRHVRRRSQGMRAPLEKPRVAVLIVLGLFFLHGVEIWIYASLYCVLGAVSDLRQAVYFSSITYGAIGFSEAAIAPQWQLVAAIEGINGVLLIGWTTAFFVTVMARLQRR